MARRRRSHAPARSAASRRMRRWRRSKCWGASLMVRGGPRHGLQGGYRASRRSRGPCGAGAMLALVLAKLDNWTDITNAACVSRDFARASGLAVPLQRSLCLAGARAGDAKLRGRLDGYSSLESLDLCAGPRATKSSPTTPRPVPSAKTTFSARPGQVGELHHGRVPGDAGGHHAAAATPKFMELHTPLRHRCAPPRCCRSPRLSCRVRVRTQTPRLLARLGRTAEGCTSAGAFRPGRLRRAPRSLSVAPP